KIIDSRVKSANLLFHSLQKTSYHIPFFISASAVGIYPDSLEKLYYEDNESVDDSFLGEVVVRWEAAADQFKNADIKVAKVRTGMVLAKEGGALPKLKDPAAFNIGAPLGSGKQWQSWIHIDDLVHIYLHILEQKLDGVYNAVAPNPVTNKELTLEIAERLGKSVWLPNVPSVALQLVLGDMSQVVLSSQLVSSDKIEQSGYSFIFKNIQKALADLL
ncbi:MAG: TIGR01777 family oxidoreductase, partial [Gillisia sp.]